MVSFAQTNSGNDTVIDNPTLTAANDNGPAVVTQNENNNFDDQVKIYPTVTEDIIYFGIKEDKSYKFTITVYDIYGKKQNAEIHNGTININELEPGIYMIQFTCKKFSITKNVVRK